MSRVRKLQSKYDNILSLNNRTAFDLTINFRSMAEKIGACFPGF